MQAQTSHFGVSVPVVFVKRSVHVPVVPCTTPTSAVAQRETVHRGALWGCSSSSYRRSLTARPAKTLFLTPKSLDLEHHRVDLFTSMQNKIILVVIVVLVIVGNANYVIHNRIQGDP